MGMDGIGGVGALNVSSQTRVTRPQSETVDVNTGSTAGQQQVQVVILSRKFIHIGIISNKAYCGWLAVPLCA